MTCINCFFESSYQQLLKKRTFGIARFENRLEEYKKLYIEEIKKLTSVDKCTCKYRFDNPEYLNFTNDFLENLLSNISTIDETFQRLISIYKEYISDNQKKSLDSMWDFINTNNLATGSEHALTYNNLLFRGRPNGSIYDIDNPSSFFHIPFDKRHLIKNQRFSISGQPMLYYSKSVIGVIKEFGEPISNLNLSAFLPNFSGFYNKKVFILKNRIFDVFVKSLPSILSTDFFTPQLKYENSQYTPNSTSIVKDIQNSILTEILTFPVKQKESFVEEYVLPQMLTTILMNEKYSGIIFPSTKDYSNFSNMKLNSEFNMNLALFVKYSETNEQDEELKKTLAFYSVDSSKPLTITAQETLEMIEKVLVIKRPKKNITDYLLPLTKAKSHITELIDSELDGVKYYDTKAGKVELKLFLKMSEHMKKLIKESFTTDTEKNFFE